MSSSRKRRSAMHRWADKERALFEQVIAEARPLSRLSEDSATPAKARRSATDVTGGLDGRTEERLRRGLIDPQARLDLHGFTEHDAHRALLSFLGNAQVRRRKLVPVGDGEGGRG